MMLSLKITNDSAAKVGIVKSAFSEGTCRKLADKNDYVAPRRGCETEVPRIGIVAVQNLHF